MIELSSDWGKAPLVVIPVAPRLGGPLSPLHGQVFPVASFAGQHFKLHPVYFPSYVVRSHARRVSVPNPAVPP